MSHQFGAAAAAILGVTLLAACSNGSTDSGADSGGGDASWESELVAEGKLTIGTSGNFAPYTYMNGEQPVGYSVEQCAELANRMDLEPEFVVMDFSGIMTGVQSGRIDVVCSGELSQTEERKQSNSFYLSVPTLRDTTGVVATTDSEAQSLEDARGANVGAISGSASPVILTKHFEDDVQITNFPGLAEATAGLEQGRVDFFTASNLVLNYIASENDAIRVVEAGLAPTDGGLIISRNEALRDEVNRNSEEMLEDGTIGDLQEKWFGTTALPEDN